MSYEVTYSGFPTSALSVVFALALPCWVAPPLTGCVVDPSLWAAQYLAPYAAQHTKIQTMMSNNTCVYASYYLQYLPSNLVHPGCALTLLDNSCIPPLPSPVTLCFCTRGALLGNCLLYVSCITLHNFKWYALVLPAFFQYCNCGQSQSMPPWQSYPHNYHQCYVTQQAMIIKLTCRRKPCWHTYFPGC